jgi:prolipoprotein diacylglyceryltransferase
MSGNSPWLVHTLFEVCAYAVGVRIYLWQRRRLALPALADREHSLWIVVAAAMGAALGSKLAFWAEDPAQAFLDFPDWRHLLEGKSIVGGLLGGLVGVELCKKWLAQAGSTGDAFVLALAVGMGIGRLGCFFAGLADRTFGNPTGLPWAVDFGDGIPRHPAQLYEIVFIAGWTGLVLARRSRLARPGDAFKLYLAGYLLFRLAVEAIKPIPMVYPPGLSGIQWLCLAGLAYYAPHLPRLVRGLAWGTS